jgi:hypothetical protein
LCSSLLGHVWLSYLEPHTVCPSKLYLLSYGYPVQSYHMKMLMPKLLCFVRNILFEDSSLFEENNDIIYCAQKGCKIFCMDYLVFTVYIRVSTICYSFYHSYQFHLYSL